MKKEIPIIIAVLRIGLNFVKNNIIKIIPNNDVTTAPLVFVKNSSITITNNNIIIKYLYVISFALVNMHVKKTTDIIRYSAKPSHLNVSPPRRKSSLPVITDPDVLSRINFNPGFIRVAIANNKFTIKITSNIF